MGGGRTFLDFENGALDLVASADAHDDLHGLAAHDLPR
jgi:hypothetical protein